MDFSQVRQFLRQAEDELIVLISKTDDFVEREQCLELAKQVRELSDALRQGNDHPSVVELSSISSAEQEAPNVDSSELPVYFIHEGFLYKVGRRGDGRTYKKSVPKGDVDSICGVIATLLGNSADITTGGIKDQLEGMPDYKIQVVVMALVKSGALVSAGRGRYARGSVAQPRPKMWARDLGKLPDRFDLIG